MAYAAYRNIIEHLPTLNGITASIIQLVLRVGLGGIFWVSARTKVDGLLTLSDSTIFLFEEEYAVPLLAPDTAAYLATYSEHLFPIMLLIGLGTRFAAFSLFFMTLVIQLFVYPDAFLSPHLGWMAMSAAVMAYGPGAFSLDHVLVLHRDGRA